MSDEGKREAWYAEPFEEGDNVYSAACGGHRIFADREEDRDLVVELLNASIPDPAALVEAARAIVKHDRECTFVQDACCEQRIRALRTALNPEEPHDGD